MYIKLNLCGSGIGRFRMNCESESNIVADKDANLQAGLSDLHFIGGVHLSRCLPLHPEN